MMQRLLIVLTMVFFSGTCLAQDLFFTSPGPQNASPVFLKDPSTGLRTASTTPRGLRMRNTGRALTICGGALAIGGIIMMNSADELYYTTTSGPSGTIEEGDPKGALGVLMTVAGVGMAVPGIIFWSKGQKKYNRYLEQQSVSLNSTASGLSLCYSF
jgi:hypothetical protein